ncbi:hypothetical protein MKW92_042667 [Papaver armeniacum]|nr:hypothetical protein MKW92_042667 [Papaver armeniacum]
MLLISGLILSKKKIIFDDLLFGVCGVGNLSLKGILHRTVIVISILQLVEAELRDISIGHTAQGFQREIQWFDNG